MSLLYETETAVLPVLDASAGLISGIAGVCVSQPFDTVRVRAQVLQKPVLQTLHGTVESGAAVGLYRGVVPALCATTLVSTTVFTSLEFAKRTLSTLRGKSTPTASPLIDTFLGGGFSGMVVSTLTSPLHRIKVQLQANDPRGTSTAPAAPGHTIRATINCATSVLRQEGIRGLYLGWRTQLLSETIGRGVYFGTYETCKRTFWLEETTRESGSTSGREDGRGGGRGGSRVGRGGVLLHTQQQEGEKTVPLYGRIVSGAISGVVGWTVIYPIDVIKNRLQAQVISPGAKSKWLEVATRLHRQGGLLAFYRGWSVMVFRALPVSSIALPTYDLVHLELKRRNQLY